MRNNGFLGVGGQNIAHSTTNPAQTSNPKQLKPGQPVSQFERQQAMKSAVNREIRKLGAAPSVVYKLYDPVPAQTALTNKDLPFIQSPGIRFSEGGDLIDANAAGGGIPAWNTRKGIGQGIPYRLSQYRTTLSRIHGHRGPFGG